MERNMKSKRRIAAACFLILVCLCVGGYAQKTDKIQDLENRIEILEGQKENLEKQVSVMQYQVESKLIDIDDQFKAEVKNLQEEKKNNNWLIAAIIVAVIFIGFGGFFGIRKNINKTIKKKMDEWINKEFPKIKEEFLEAAKKQGEEFKVKEKKSILVISKKEADETFLKMFFEERGFNSRNVNYMRLGEAKNVEKYDLVLFNNESDKKEQSPDHSKEIEVMAKTKKDAIGFYFGPNRFESEDYKNKINFANSRPQLYGNLINSLRYQSLLK